MTLHRSLRSVASWVVVFVLSFSQLTAGTENVALPEGTRLYVELQESLRGKKNEVSVGQVVHCKVWRDLVVGGQVLVKAGTPVMAKVDSLKTRKIAGVKGKMSLGAYETTAVDGQTVQLVGGYMKEGKSRMAVSITLAAVLLWPLIFIPGKAAELPEGMVFDVFTGPDMDIRIPEEASRSPVINLAHALSPITAEVLIDKLDEVEKPKVFTLRVVVEDTVPEKLVIDTVNGSEIEPIPLQVVSTKIASPDIEFIAEVKIKTLVKKFTKGINRFEISFVENGERFATEVVLNLQF